MRNKHFFFNLLVKMEFIIKRSVKTLYNQSLYNQYLIITFYLYKQNNNFVSFQLLIKIYI